MGFQAKLPVDLNMRSRWTFHKQTRLPFRTLVLYALPSLVTSVAALPMALFVPAFYADELGLPLAAVGVAIAASRLLDVVTDPLIGSLSDRFETRWGRRKPWMIAGTPLFLVALWQVFVPGESASTTHLLVWSALLYLGFTMIDLPHKAWGAELSADYDERSRITSWREALSTAGQVGLLAFVLLLGARGVDGAAEQLRGIAWLIVLGLPVLVALAVLGVPEGRPEGFDHERRSFLDGLRLVARNPAFGRMIGCVVLFVSGIAIQGTLHRLVLADVMGDESLFPLMIFIENLATLAAVPLWLWLSMRIGKHRALMAAALWLAVLSLPLALLREGDTRAADRLDRVARLELRLDPVPRQLHGRGRHRRRHPGLRRAALGSVLRRLGHGDQAFSRPRRSAWHGAAGRLRLRPVCCRYVAGCAGPLDDHLRLCPGTDDGGRCTLSAPFSDHARKT